MNWLEKLLLGSIHDKLEALMTKAEDANAKLDRINAATTNIAADIRGLKVAAGMTQAEADAVNARLESTATALEAIAAETPDETAPPSAKGKH